MVGHDWLRVRRGGDPRAVLGEQRLKQLREVSSAAMR
jgi:hypothetical protein